MRRILRSLILCAAVIGFAWAVASLPGRVSAEIGPYSVQTSEPIAVAALLLVFLVLYLLIRLTMFALRVPRFGSLWRTGRRRRAGDAAVTRALVALAAGEKADARKEAGRARALLGDTPQTLLLAAEAGRLSGRDDETVHALQALASRKDSAFLGLRGLLAQAIARQNWTEAAEIARKAEAAHPGAAWLRQERAQLAIRSGNWTEALALAAPGAPKTALMVGAAQAEANPDRAEKLARQALKADPTFTPAVLTLANQLRTRGRADKALDVLTEGWKRQPHPDIAALALADVTGKDDRLRAATRLTAGAPRHAESQFLLARTSLDAGKTGDARHHLEAAVAAGLDQRRVWLLAAELEEEERGDTEAGRSALRDALRRASGADPDPEWRCTVCHTPRADWRAACPECQTAGSVSWLAGTVRAMPHAEAISRAA